MNDTIKTQLAHRSIRAYKSQNVPKEIVETLLNVANRTATSTGMQTYSIIRITDLDLKQEISKICMQPYAATAPELWIFIVDAFRNANIAAEQGCFLEERRDMERFFQGFTDAALSAQNVMNGLESLGLGGVFFGSILNDSEKICELLKLPAYTFPVVGIGFGYPDQQPQLKPRMGLDLKVFENEYKVQDNYLEAIKSYDEEMQTYYDLRDTNKRVDSFSHQVVQRLENTLEKRSKILNIVRKQGFDFRLEYIPENEIKTMYRKVDKSDIKDEIEFEQSKSGLRLDTKVADLFERYSFIKLYLQSINPKFNNVTTLLASPENREMTIEDLANIGEMPADSLIYMIESSISEEA